MADKVIEALINPTVLNQIVPILSEKIAESVAESINKALEKKINDHIKPLEKKINDQDNTIVEQKDMMQKQASMIGHICKKMVKLRSPSRKGNVKLRYSIGK
jgi:hypothetical protein